MSKIDDMDLMYFADGELSGTEHERVAAHVSAGGSNSDARLKVESLGEVTESVRTYLEVSADEAEPGFAGMWDNIERRIQSNGIAATASESVREGETRAAATAPGLWAAVKQWFGESRGHFFAGAATAGAVAAIVLVMRPVDYSPGHEHVAHTTQGTPAMSASPRTIPVTMPVLEPVSAAATVEELNVVDGVGHILSIPGEEGEAPTTVIWLDIAQATLEDPI